MGDAEEVPGVENKKNRRFTEDFFENLSADRRFFIMAFGYQNPKSS